jgi:hypothetical protein
MIEYLISSSFAIFLVLVGSNGTSNAANGRRLFAVLPITLLMLDEGAEQASSVINICCKNRVMQFTMRIACANSISFFKGLCALMPT